MSALLVGLRRIGSESWEKKKQKLISGMAPWLVGKGSSSCQVPAEKDPDIFILVKAHYCLADLQISLENNKNRRQALIHIFMLLYMTSI